MKIEKIGEEVLYKRVTIEHTLNINGKEVKVLEYRSSDDLEDYDYEVDSNDKNQLSDEEINFLDEYEGEMINNEVGHYVEVKE